MSAIWDHHSQQRHNGSLTSAQQDILGLVDPRREVGRPSKVWMKFLHQITMGSRDFGGASAFFQPENFIGFILGNRRSAAAARLARLTAPRVKVRIACRAPSGKAAIQIRL
jgi:hypothetical protein